MKKRTKQTEQVELTKQPELPDEPEKAPAQYAVNHRFGLNLRAEPSKASAVVRVLEFNEVITVCGDSVAVGGVEWLPVDGGYVDAAYLRMMEV